MFLSDSVCLNQTRRVSGFAVHLESTMDVLCVYVCVCVGEEGEGVQG